MKKLLLSIAALAISANAATVLATNSTNIISTNINILKQNQLNDTTMGMNLVVYSALTGGYAKAIVTFTGQRVKDILSEDKKGQAEAMLYFSKSLISTKFLNLGKTKIKDFSNSMKTLVNERYTDFINLLKKPETIQDGFTMEVKRLTSLHSWAFVNSNNPFHTTNSVPQAKDSALYGVNFIAYDTIPLIHEFTHIGFNHSTLNEISSTMTVNQLVNLLQNNQKFFYNSLATFSENIIDISILTPIADIILKNIGKIKQYDTNKYGVIIPFSKLTLGSWTLGQVVAQDMNDN